MEWCDLKKFLTMFDPRGVKRFLTFLKQFQEEKKTYACQKGQNIFVLHTQSKLPQFCSWNDVPFHYTHGQRESV